MTHEPTPSTIVWRKSSHSGPQGGNCVEVAAANGHVLVRDSKQPDSARLNVTSSAWAAFLAGIQAGDFDLG